MLIQTELVMFASLLGPMLSSSVVSEKLRHNSIAISQSYQQYKIYQYSCIYNASPCMK